MFKYLQYLSFFIFTVQKYIIYQSAFKWRKLERTIAMAAIRKCHSTPLVDTTSCIIFEHVNHQNLGVGYFWRVHFYINLKLYCMESQLQTMIDNMLEKTGKSLEEWKKLLKAKNFEKHGQAVAFLKKNTVLPTDLPIPL